MTEIQRTVDELRFLLQREVLEQSEELTGLVREYSQHCHAANVRLRRCDDNLKKGLRSEALHLAEAPPVLLDVVAVLDFPERDDLLELLSMYSMAAPEPLLLDVASELNDAYAQQAPLEKLLETHRLLALGRCPLSQRLPVLRSLAQQDTASAHWEADVRDMERARLGELDAESRAAASRGDTVALKSLLDEVQSARWLEKVPPTLVKSLKSRMSTSQRGGARARMEALESELYAAFSALDVARARGLRDEWERCQQEALLPQNDPLREQIAPVFGWLEDEDRKLESERAYLKGVAEIEAALADDHVTIAHLRRIGLAFDRLERSLPETLESRFRHRLATLEIMETRRRQLMMAGFVAATVIVVGAIVSVLFVNQQAEHTRRLAAAVDSLVNEGKLDAARKMVDQQPSGLTAESWLAAQKKLIDAELAEKERVTQLQAELETLNGTASGPEAEAAVERARKLARTPDEKIKVGKLRQEWQQKASQEADVRDTQFRKQLTLAGDALKAFDRALEDAANPDRLESLLREAEARIVALRASQRGVPAELVSQADLLASRLRASHQAVADLTRRLALLDKLTETVLMRPAEFEPTLRTYLKDLPNDPQTGAMKVAAESCSLPAFLARQILASRWENLYPADKALIESRVREIRSYLTEHSATPDREPMLLYEKWLSAVLRRYSEDGDPDEGVRQRLTALYKSKFIRDGHVLKDALGHVYYLTQARTEAFGDLASFKYLIGFNGETREVTMKPTEVGFKTMPPPQQAVSQKILSDLQRNLKLDNWQPWFKEHLELLWKAEDIDPFLRYLLVLKTLEFAGRGDHFLEEELAPLLSTLNDDELDTSVAWMDPRNVAADAARTRAKELLAGFPVGDLEKAFSRAAQRQDELQRLLHDPRFPVGWLEKLPSGEWQCRTKWKPSAKHLLSVASPIDAAGSRTWMTIGRTDGTSLTLIESIVRSAGEASVVYAAPVETQTTKQP